MKNKFKIVSLKSSDVTEISKVYVRAYRTRGEKWTDKRASALIKSYLKKQPDMAIVAILDRRLVGGFFCLVKPWWDGNHMIETEIFVDPRAHKQGIGQALFQEILTRAKKKYEAVVFEGITFSKLKFPISWYNKIGIKKAEELMFIDGKVDVILKKLKQSTKGNS